VEEGVTRGQQQAMATVDSWGSGDKRSKDKPSGGVTWNAYFATARNDGCYTSNAYGEIDWNQELTAPVQQAFVAGWDQTFNTKVNELLHTCREAFKDAALHTNTLIQRVCCRESKFVAVGISPLNPANPLTCVSSLVCARTGAGAVGPAA
jgi:hypothetical protein